MHQFILFFLISTEQKRKEQESMPITYIDDFGYEVPIPELTPEEFEVNLF